MIKKNINKKKNIIILTMIVIFCLTIVLALEISYYNPNRSVQIGWGGTGDSSHTQITDNARQPNTPNTGTYVSTRSNNAQESIFGFPNVTEKYIKNITLWVYAQTTATTQFTFSLTQGGTTINNTLVPIGTTTPIWTRTVWHNPSGDLSDLRIHLGPAIRPGTGAHNDVWVYAAYLEINYILPPNVTIISPENNSEEKANNNITFTYYVEDIYEINNCSLRINNTFYNETNNVEKNINNYFYEYLENGIYEWEILCQNEEGATGTSGIRTLYVNVYEPIITSVSITNVTNLNPGITKTVYCNVTVQDGNGANDIVNVNTSLHLSTINNFEENKNTAYINNSCDRLNSGNVAEFFCSYNLYYYAESGTWNCNVTAYDQQGLGTNNYNTTLVDELYAINLSSLTLNYGQVPVGGLSLEQDLEVYNIGNQPINVYVRGYGGSIPALGEDLSMICENEDTIPVNNQRFSLNQGIPFENKNQLSSNFQTIINNLAKQTTEEQITRNTYWTLLSPIIGITNCEGTIVFSVIG